MQATYLGSLRCEAQHIKSGVHVITDAPPDNKGRGEAFSPTDLMCTSLAVCMITIMGITSNEKGIKLGGVKADIEKIMASNPRRVLRINIKMLIEDCGLSQKDKSILENAAITCPVARSLNAEIVQDVQFEYLEPGVIS